MNTGNEKTITEDSNLCYSNENDVKYIININTNHKYRYFYVTLHNCIYFIWFLWKKNRKLDLGTIR